MPISPLETAGAAIQPTSAAPLHVNEFFTGLWTNGNPLGPGAVPYIYAKSYSASRYDRLFDGNDIEVSPRLTLIRRPGHKVYNSSLFPPINRFYEFRGFTANDEAIHLIADCDAGIGSSSGTVREVTQPSTNKILWTKNAGAGKTSFVSDGNILYAGDGNATHKWVTSAQSWQANTQYQPGDFIVDPNGNLQLSVGGQTANLTNIQIDAIGGSQFKVTVWMSPSTPLNIANNVWLQFVGLSTEPGFNLQWIQVQVDSSTQFHWITTGVTAIAFSPETGTATTGTGISSSVPPTWNTTLGGVSTEGLQQWINMGSAVQSWGGFGPTAAPTVSMTPAPSVFPNHAINTWYSPNFVITDSNNNIQQLVQGGTTGGGTPSWATTLNAITNDGSCQWKMIGANAWQASHHYAVGQSVVVSYTYYITVPVRVNIDGTWVTYYQQQAVNATSVFQCTVSGNSGTTQPAWNNGVGTTTTDFQVRWLNTGPATSGGNPWPGTSPGTQTLSTASEVVDENGYLEKATVQGKTGGTAPTWSTDPGASTTDGAQTWVNAGAFAPAATEPWQWAYSGMNSITGEISTASSLSAPLIPTVGNIPVIQGQGLTEPPWDTIILWRTDAGGSTLFYEDQFPNPGTGQTWIYSDTNPDSALNHQMLAPIAGLNGNDPPPANFVPMAYYLGRIWGFANNKLIYSGGPDTTTGAGNSTFPTKNRFTLPSKGIWCWTTSIGLILMTTSDIWAVLGQGTDISPFYVVMFQQGIGLLSQDAFGVNGSTAYAMISSHQVISMDPGAGETEVGFPIANFFDSYYDPAKAYVTWHQGLSADTALYVANGSSYWYRMAAASAPESGNIWSPAGVMRAPGHVRAMASIETSPGIKVLIAGPDVNNNPILMRDATTNGDNGVAYPAHALIAPVVLAQPGSTAAFQFAVTEEKMIDGSTPMMIRVLFDEIIDYVHIHNNDFRVLRNITKDPPNLPASKSVRTQRHWATQDPSTVIKCRFYMQDLVWATENYPNELFTNTVYGRLPEKARK